MSIYANLRPRGSELRLLALFLGVGLVLVALPVPPAETQPVVSAPAVSASPALQATDKIEVTHDIAYCDGAGADPQRHKLDCFFPKGQRGFPVLVLVHGGAWVCGDKSFFGWGTALGEYFARQGIGVVMPSYRLWPGADYRQQAQDVASVVAWTLQHAAAHGGRPDRVFLGGHSAGGHLAALVATDPSFLRGVGVKPAQIRGVVTVSGVYQIGEVAVPLGRAASQFRLDPFWLIFGRDPKARRAASPLDQVHAGLAPFLLVCADHDLPGLEKMAGEFAAALRKAGGEVQFIRAADRDHESVMFDAHSAEDPVARAIVDFVARHL
jgi:acetyl esterase/lipase